MEGGWLVVLTIVIIVLLIQVIWPRTFWSLEAWKVRHPDRAEPSRAYLFFTRVLSLGVIIYLVVTIAANR